MLRFFLFALLFTTVPLMVVGHREMQYPLPIGKAPNTPPDSDLHGPITVFPCKGKLSGSIGEPVVTYKPGGSYNIVLKDSYVTHNGGSCQISLSFDMGKSWKVIKSIIGDCPHHPSRNSDSFTFRMPDDVKEGKAIFAWTWINNTGNREFYMNCAHVMISAQAGSGNPPLATEVGSTTRSFKMKDIERTPLFLANMPGVDCLATAQEGHDVIFPNPGPIVETSPNARSPMLPTGSGCGGVVSGGGGGNGGGTAPPDDKNKPTGPETPGKPPKAPSFPPQTPSSPPQTPSSPPQVPGTAPNVSGSPAQPPVGSPQAPGTGYSPQYPSIPSQSPAIPFYPGVPRPQDPNTNSPTPTPDTPTDSDSDYRDVLRRFAGEQTQRPLNDCTFWNRVGFKCSSASSVSVNPYWRLALEAGLLTFVLVW